MIERGHPKALFEKFQGYKKFLVFDGTHNSRRPPDIHNEIKNFFIERLEQPVAKSGPK